MHFTKHLRDHSEPSRWKVLEFFLHWGIYMYEHFSIGNLRCDDGATELGVSLLFLPVHAECIPS